VLKRGTRQCAVVHLEKHGRVHLRVGSKYLGVVGGALRVVDGVQSAAAFRFERGNAATEYAMVTDSGSVTVEASTGAFYVKQQRDASSTLVVTGVPKQDAIAVHDARVDASGAVVRADGPQAIVATLLAMDGKSVYGIYVTKETSDLLEESMEQASKVRAMHASCCSRFRASCVDEADSLLKPMCCNECKDTLDTCAELVRYDAGPLIKRETCCKSIAMLGVRRVYGDTECADVPGSCDPDVQIEYTRLAALGGVFVPSFGEVAVARFLCNELYSAS